MHVQEGDAIWSVDLGRRKAMNRPSDLNRRSISLMDYQAIVGNSWRSKFIFVLIVLMTCGLTAVRLATAQDIPDGTIQLAGGSVAVGIGYTWGKGTLFFDGKRYPFAVDGLSIINVGASGYTASGTVYHLTKVTDFQGVYTAVSAGAAVAGGVSGTAMKNSNGVVIQMSANHAGLGFSLGPKGVNIALGPSPE
jgi:hypothetical protein